MPEPYVGIARYTAADTTLTALETSLNTVDDDTDLIVADVSAALTAKNNAVSDAKKITLDFLLVGG